MLVGTGVCMAQQNRGGDRSNREQRIEKMVKDLELNEVQAKDFKAAMEEMRPARNNSGERPSREEMEKKRNELDAKIKSILTEEQYKKYKEMHQQQQNKQRERKKTR